MGGLLAVGGRLPLKLGERRAKPSTGADHSGRRSSNHGGPILERRGLEAETSLRHQSTNRLVDWYRKECEGIKLRGSPSK